MLISPADAMHARDRLFPVLAVPAIRSPWPRCSAGRRTWQRWPGACCSTCITRCHGPTAPLGSRASSRPRSGFGTACGSPSCISCGGPTSTWRRSCRCPGRSVTSAVRTVRAARGSTFWKRLSARPAGWNCGPSQRLPRRPRGWPFRRSPRRPQLLSRCRCRRRNRRSRRSRRRCRRDSNRVNERRRKRSKSAQEPAPTGRQITAWGVNPWLPTEDAVPRLLPGADGPGYYLSPRWGWSNRV